MITAEGARSLRPALAANPIAAFTATDAILEEDVVPTVNNYLDNGGDVITVGKMLMESYEGRPNIILALHEWCNDFGDGDAVLREAVRAACSKHEQTFIQHFDTSFGQDPQNCIDVIDEAMDKSQLAPFVTELAEKNKNSILSEHVLVHKRLALANIPKSVFSSDKNFIKWFCTSFEDSFATPKRWSNVRLSKFFKKVAIVCAHNELTFMISTAALELLSREAEDPAMRGVYKRAGQEIRREAISYMMALSLVPDVVVRQFTLRMLIVNEAASEKVFVEKQVLDALTVLIECQPRRRCEKEIKVLMHAYGRLIGDLGISSFAGGDVVENVQEYEASVSQKFAMIRILCLPEVLDKLIFLVFAHANRTYIGGNPDFGKRRCVCLLLSYASNFIPLDGDVARASLSNPISKNELRLSIHKTFENLNTTAEVCEALKPGAPAQKIKGKPVQILLKGVSNPLLARGILTWAKEGLNGGLDLRHLVGSARKHLGFMEAIVKHHPGLCAQILSAMHKAFVRDYVGLSREMVREIRSAFMKTITSMLRYPVGPQVILTFKTQWANLVIMEKQDMRTFVRGALQTVSPPYPRSLLEALNDLLRQDRVKEAIAEDQELIKMLSDLRTK